MPAGFQGGYFLSGFVVATCIAQGLADEDEEQESKASGQGGDDGDQGFLRFGSALWGLGRVQHLDDCAFAGFVHAGQFVLFGKEFKQGFVVFEFTVFADVVALACGGIGGVVFVLFGQLGAQVGQLVQGLFEVWRGLGQVAAHGTHFDFLDGDLGLEGGDAGYGAGGVALEHAVRDAGGLERLLGGSEFVFGLDELLFKEEATLLGFGHGQTAQHFAQLFHIGVGHVGCKLGVFVVKLNADQAVFATGYAGVLCQCFAGVGFVFLIVTVLQLEAFDQAVLHGVALHVGDELVGGIFDACCRTCQTTQPAQALQQTGGGALLGLGGQELGFGGVGGGNGKADAQCQHAHRQRAEHQQAQVVNDGLQQVEETDFVFFLVCGGLGGVGHTECAGTCRG